MKVHHLAFIVAMLLCSSAANAEAVALRFEDVTPKLQLALILDDNRASIEDCKGGKGRHVALILLLNNDFPDFEQSKLYAKGCWYFAKDKVVMNLKASVGNRPLKFEYPVSAFERNPDIKHSWDYFGVR